jgi:hypothetical protein
MLAGYAIENVIQKKLSEIGCSIDAFAFLSQKSQTRLSRAFRGVAPLENTEGVKLNALADELVELCQDAAPFPLSFKNGVVIQQLLDLKRSGRLRPAGAGASLSSNEQQ